LSTLLLIALAPHGCRSARDQKLADVPIEARPLVAAFPPDGALHLFGDVPIQVVLGGGADATTLDVTYTTDTGTTAAPCELTYDDVLATCGEIGGMKAGDAVQLDIALDGNAFVHATDGRLPAPGLGWDLFTDVELTALGGGSEAVSAAKSQLQPSAVAVLDGYDGTDGSWMFTVSPGGPFGDGTFGESHWGFGFLLPVEVAGGVVTGDADTAWLAAVVEGDNILLLLLDVHLDAQLVGDQLQGMTLSATLPALSLVEVSDAVGDLGPLLLDLIKLDVDYDGDGAPDSATIRFEGSPPPAVLSGWP
jgi:hypothetical protein